MDFHKIEQRNMKHIRIKKYRDVFAQYLLNCPDLVVFLNNRNSAATHVTGGGGNKTKKIKYTFENYTFTLYETKVTGGYDISIKRKNDPEDPQTCLHIMTNSEAKLAYIQNISYYKDCVDTGLEQPGGGSILLRLCIKFLTDNKKKYKINRIQLTDRSLKTCDRNGAKINFAIMHTLMFGDTWYGKYGFRPYDPVKNIRYEKNNESYNRNIRIVGNTIVKNTNLFNYLEAVIETDKTKSKREIAEIVNKYYKLYGNYTIRNFFMAFLSNYDASCAMFSGFYDNYAENQKLWDPFGSSFYLDI